MNEMINPKKEQTFGFLEILLFIGILVFELLDIIHIQKILVYILFALVFITAFILSYQNQIKITLPYFIKYHNISAGLLFALVLVKKGNPNHMIVLMFYITSFLGVLFLPVLARPAYEYVNEKRREEIESFKDKH